MIFYHSTNSAENYQVYLGFWGVLQIAYKVVMSDCMSASRHIGLSCSALLKAKLLGLLLLTGL
jgi:hypothetical protein